MSSFHWKTGLLGALIINAVAGRRLINQVEFLSRTPHPKIRLFGTFMFSYARIVPWRESRKY
jgi:hypothetical protein